MIKTKRIQQLESRIEKLENEVAVKNMDTPNKITLKLGNVKASALISEINKSQECVSRSKQF